MIIRQRSKFALKLLMISILTTFALPVSGSVGDRLPDFKECVTACISVNCQRGDAALPIGLRLLLWTCPANCDYTCQHVITDRRVAKDPPIDQPVVQYHGKWPFHRFMGAQEPFSVLFSFLNFVAHQRGLAKIYARIPESYALRRYYVMFGYFGLASWIFSMIFHTRDFGITESLDYYAAGASVFYGLYYTPIRIFRLEEENPPIKQTVLRLWTFACVMMFVAHISYLTFWKWDYTYNMAANVVAGVVSNLLWSWFSIMRYQRSKKPWAAWPGLIVAWIVLAMSLELLDFPPIGGMIDAHSLWHLGTVVPTIWWYSFLIKDAEQDISGDRLKA